MALPDEVVQSFPEEIRNEPSLQGFNDIGSIAKAFVDTKSLVGRSIQLPPKDATPEVLEKWKSEQGAKLMPHLPTLGFDLPPPSPDKYDLKVPDGFDPNLEKSFRETAHKLGLPSSKVQGLVDFYHQQNQAALKQIMQTPEMAEKEARELVGTEYDTIMAHATAGLESLKAANPGVGSFFETSMLVEKLEDGSTRVYPLAKHPNMIGLLEIIGELTSADQGGNAGKGGSSVEQGADEAEREAKDIMFNKENPKYKVYHGSSGEERTQMREYVNRLLAKKHTGSLEI